MKVEFGVKNGIKYLWYIYGNRDFVDILFWRSFPLNFIVYKQSNSVFIVMYEEMYNDMQKRYTQLYLSLRRVVRKKV